METFVMILVFIAVFAALGVASLSWGTDSRPAITDDHAR
jgi:hypothetical protein